MPEYRVYLIRDGRISRAEDIVAADDAQALDMAAKIAAGQPYEVWSGKRMVKSRGLGKASGV